MSTDMERYSENTNITLDDFKRCGWVEALGEVRQENYSSMWQALSAAARQALADQRLSEGKALWLLADTCSMILKPASLNEPFVPFMLMDGKRSALPEDFQPDDVTFFKEIFSEIEDPKLCARISDITWLLAQPRDPKYALSAIDNYRQISINTDSWIRYGRECWDRAIQLCLMLRAGAGERLKEIETTIVDSLNGSSYEDGYLALHLSDLLAKHKLGGKGQVAISQKLGELAFKFEDSGDFRSSRDYFDVAADWYQKTEDSEKFAEMITRNAEGWAKAAARQASGTPSHMVAASFYEKAIQKYRTIPKALRKKHDVDNRMAELRKELNKAREHSLDEMGVVSSGSIDISEPIQNAIKAVQGKPALDALLAFTNLYRGAQVENIRQFSEEMLSKHPMQSLFLATYMSTDGRVIAKRPGADLGREGSEAALRPEMVKHYVMEVDLIVQGYIWPALEVIRQEHWLKEADFYSIVRQSPIIPPNRMILVAKALYLGFDNDFVSALHLLVPQIEHLVRFHLKQNGVKTTNLDINGIENENGLNALMENTETNEIFGKDLAFEIRSLFCDPFGPNLRNELAHGLIGYEESQSIYSIYAWWLTFRIMFDTFGNARQQNQQQPEPETAEQDSNV